MTTTLLLIRHGQTDWNAAGRWQGQIDIPLNDTGRGQVQALARRLAGWPVRVIYSSDLLRAAETAAILGRSFGLKPVYKPALRERNSGIFQGMLFEEVQAHYPEQYQQLLENGDAPPGGESAQEVSWRVAPVYEQVASRHRGQAVIMVGHGGALRILLAHIFGRRPAEARQFILRYNGGLTIVELNETGPHLALLDDVSHLEVEVTSNE
ncbi:MAG: histidine phosphatase family protein [Chloroflexi bacterium]|nr:histidine phosphatase family protein [Chloroflexota bacterium]MCI0577518.1 histidine phosphatase family protein [Chloroflexota bacterium]MCI0645643.1 histidine phosphatase family protein [Chloroflexota bacterium]MCI0725555.1 histidine phosphatase family protein [Chloroflexota bacterium]